MADYTRHSTYPFRIPCSPTSGPKEWTSLQSKAGKATNHQADLDLLYFEAFIPRPLERERFKFLRSELPFYRVEYIIKRGGVETQVQTPRSAP